MWTLLALLWSTPALGGVTPASVELGAWHVAAGIGFGATAPGPEGEPSTLGAGVGAIIGVAIFPVADLDLSGDRVMMIETSEVVGGLVLGGLAAASFQGEQGASPAATWGAAVLGAAGGGLVGGFLIEPVDPGRHALVRAGLLWGVYYTDLSFAVVPARRDAPLWIRYGGGALLGAGTGLALGGLGPTRSQVNVVSASGAAGAVVMFLITSSNQGVGKAVALGLAPVAGGALAVTLMRESSSSDAAVRVIPQVDWATGQKGVRLEGSFR